MDAPDPALLWLFTWLCAASVGIGTIVFFSVAGTYGQLIALLAFVYAGLAASGGTVPLQALPGFLRTLSNVEPLRQVLAGTRSILYFKAQADAGLTRGVLAAGLGLLIWLVVGTVVVRWYDRKRFYRLQPELLAHVNTSVQEYRAQQVATAPAHDGPTQRVDAVASAGRLPQADQADEQTKTSLQDAHPTQNGLQDAVHA
jgi:hypothetical protein